jgi:excisionase family DNA binding protein
MPTDDARVTGEPPAGEVMERLMTADEVAAALGVNRKFVYARQHAGALRGYKLGPQYRFRPDDVRAFLEASLAPADAVPEPRAGERRAAPAGTFRSLLEGRAA